MTLPGTLQAFPEIAQRTDEWFAQRCGIVTASVVGKLLSVRHKGAIEYACLACGAMPNCPCVSKAKRSGDATPIKTPHAERITWAARQRDDTTQIIEPADGDEVQGLVAAVAAERITGFVDPTFQSVDMMRGVEDEPYAIAGYSEHHAPVTDCGFMVRTWNGCRLGYSPDGLVGDDGLIEVKSRRGKKQVETVLSGEVPAENMPQCQAGLFVSGRAWLDYISYAGGMHLWTVRVYPDQRWFDAIAAAVEAFEANVTDTVAAYQRAVEGLPLMDRPLEDMVI